MPDQTKKMAFLIHKQIDHYTICRRSMKSVLKLAPGLDITELVDEITKQTQQKPSQIIPEKEGPKPYSYLLSFESSANLETVNSVTGLNNIKVKWEHYSKRTRATQCHLYQGFAHR